MFLDYRLQMHFNTDEGGELNNCIIIYSIFSIG